MTTKDIFEAASGEIIRSYIESEFKRDNGLLLAIDVLADRDEQGKVFHTLWAAFGKPVTARYNTIDASTFIYVLDDDVLAVTADNIASWLKQKKIKGDIFVRFLDPNDVPDENTEYIKNITEWKESRYLSKSVLMEEIPDVFVDKKKKRAKCTIGERTLRSFAFADEDVVILLARAIGEYVLHGVNLFAEPHDKGSDKGEGKIKDAADRFNDFLDFYKEGKRISNGRSNSAIKRWHANDMQK